jgi:hypothetical protein
VHTKPDYRKKRGKKESWRPFQKSSLFAGILKTLKSTASGIRFLHDYNIFSFLLLYMKELKIMQ